MKKAFLFLYFLGIILICAFRTPVRYYQFYDRWVVIHSHIFSDKGKILAGQWVLYIFIWSAFVFLVYTGLAYLKRNKY